MSDNKKDTQTADAILEQMLGSMDLRPATEATSIVQAGLVPMADERIPSQEDRFFSGLAALLYNVESAGGRFERGRVLEAVGRLDQMINEQVNEILHAPRFQEVESTWRGLEDLAANTNFSAGITIDILDVSKEELFSDFEDNSSDIFSCALFEKVYTAEYDQYGGRPFGAIVGDFQFRHVPRDLFWLRSIAKVAAASHAPFIASAAPEFFGCKTVEELAAIKNLEGVLNHPKYGDWNKFRDSDESTYIGLTLPRYVLRKPWHPDSNPVPSMETFAENPRGESDKYLWGNAAWLMARNMVQSFDQSGWCQYIRGPAGGGLISGLPVDTYELNGQEEMKIPVEIVIPDFRELEFAKSGFIPLVYRKSSADATFFSVQSVRRPRKLKDPKDAENAQLVCNLSYTFSISRIAHYVKSIMRDNIGSIADVTYIKDTLSNWLNGYITTAVNPNDLTLRRFPFRAGEIQVEPKPGQIGWYKCTISVLPHIQFEGMDVELRLESRLG